MSNINVTFNGYNVTEAYYRSSYADGSLYNQITQQQNPYAGAAGFNAPFWQNVMTTQQNLFGGWNSFCGCGGTRPQPQPPQQGPCAGKPRRIDIHRHHHYYQNGCGGPFNYGGSASTTNNTHTAFGSHGSCSSWQNSCQTSCYSPFASTGYQNVPFYGPSGYQGPSYSNSLGGWDYGCGNSFGNPQLGCGTPDANTISNTFGLPQTLPTYNWGDFSASFGGNKNSGFGVIPSAYAGYAMTSPFTDFGSAAGLAVLGGALSMLF